MSTRVVFNYSELFPIPIIIDNDLGAGEHLYSYSTRVIFDYLEPFPIFLLMMISRHENTYISRILALFPISIHNAVHTYTLQST